jgi:ATP-dependent Clp protease ATP-binding subunit ClpC
MDFPRTDRAKAIFSMAEEQAQQAGLSEVSPSHILLAMANLDRGVARRILERLSVDLPSLSEQIAVPSRMSATDSHLAALPLDATAAKLVVYAHEEAVAMNHRYLGTEHLLLGLLRCENDGVGSFLKERGVDISAARVALQAVLYGDRGTSTRSS